MLVLWFGLAILYPSPARRQIILRNKFRPQYSPSRSVLLRMRYLAMLENPDDPNLLLGCPPGDHRCTALRYPTADIAAPAVDSISLDRLRARTLPFHPGGMYVMVRQSPEPYTYCLTHASQPALFHRGGTFVMVRQSLDPFCQALYILNLYIEYMISYHIISYHFIFTLLYLQY